MRWQEEVTLTGYEMQWTVRYFLHMSHKWVLKYDDGPGGNSSTGSTPGGSSYTGTGTPGGSSATGTGTPGGATSIGTGAGHSLGAIAYSNRKHAIWMDIMNKADSTFKRCNPAYDSPL